MTVFNQENVEDYYEIGEELGRYVVWRVYSFVCRVYVNNKLCFEYEYKKNEYCGIFTVKVQSKVDFLQA